MADTKNTMTCGEHYVGHACGGAAKWIRITDDRTDYLCGKHYGIHARHESSYRSSEWTTRHHGALIKGFVKMTKFDVAKSLVAATELLHEKQAAARAAAEIVYEARRVANIKAAPKQIADEIARHTAAKNAPVSESTFRLELEDDYAGARLSVFNVNLRNAAHVRALIAALEEQIAPLVDKSVELERRNVIRLTEANANLAELESATVVAK